MTEQVFRSPGFFPREIDQSFQVSAPSGVPAGIIGTAQKGLQNPAKRLWQNFH